MYVRMYVCTYERIFMQEQADNLAHNTYDGSGNAGWRVAFDQRTIMPFVEPIATYMAGSNIVLCKSRQLLLETSDKMLTILRINVWRHANKSEQNS